MLHRLATARWMTFLRPTSKVPNCSRPKTNALYQDKLTVRMIKSPP